MEYGEFEGFMGISLYDASISNDIMIVIVVILLSIFAWIFRSNPPLFGKVIKNFNVGEHRQSIFETAEKDSFILNAFMTFQTLLLFSIFTFSAIVKFQNKIIPDTGTTLLSVGFLFVLFFIYYLFKRFLYALFGMVFIEKNTNKVMFANYQSLFCAWGVALYFPVLGVLLFDTKFLLSSIFLVISFLAFKSILYLRIFNIYYNKNTGFLFLCLYLCAQEIVPLLFLYEGMVYTYNIIETNYTWQ